MLFVVPAPFIHLKLVKNISTGKRILSPELRRIEIILEVYLSLDPVFVVEFDNKLETMPTLAQSPFHP